MEEQREYTYVSPFSERYASREMQFLFSEGHKVRTWRKLWIALAEAEQALGLPISDAQIEEMKRERDHIDFNVAKAREIEVRHDVMSHVYAYALQCPAAAPIIHLGATSCYVGDNADVLIFREAAQLIIKKCAKVLENLRAFALQNKGVACLAYTHLQPAQPTTLGKRATLWIYELLLDIQNLEAQMSRLVLLGSKGATGTQASFLDLFEGDAEKVDALEKMIAEKVGFSECVPVSGQTYSRKMDFYLLSCLSGVCQSAYKFSNDLRLLQSFEEVEEPFESHQIGSSAMPYKRNPMRAERMSSLSRYVIQLCQNTAFTAGTQWLERTLDDSANRRLTLSEAFLGTDGVLDLYINISENLHVNYNIVANRLRSKLPFMTTENILMESVKRGSDRQKTHEAIRSASMKAVKKIKEEGGDNPLLEILAASADIPLDAEEIKALEDPKKYIGLAVQQTERFIKQAVDPLLKRIQTEDVRSEIKV